MRFKPDDSQERAIQLALGSEITYIVGPPGTGKTSTLAAIAFAHLREGRTVLIAAHTNIAVDNAIMRLVDICKDSSASNEMRDGRIIRYGTPQLEERLKSEYGEVHLPTIIKQRVGYLNQRRKELQNYLDQISAQFVMMDQEKTQLAEQWQTEHQRLIAQCDVYKSELLPLQARDQQRISALDARLKDLYHQLTQSQQFVHAISQKLAQITAQHVQQQTARTQCLAEINDLTTKLAAAQQTSAFIRLFKGVNPKSLAQQLADRQQQAWNCDQKLAELQRQMNEMYSTHATAEKQVEELTSLYRTAIAQRNTLSIDAQKIVQLQSDIAKYDQSIVTDKSRLNKTHNDIEQKKSLLKSEQERIREQVAAIDKQLADTEKNIVAEAKVVATTLSKTYMNANLRERCFDVVILDEVSMAPLPAVYVAASRAGSSVIAIGDPLQLSPIFMAEASIAANDWLGKDLFDLRNITLEGAMEAYSNSTLLEQQARMHPEISKIARIHIYEEHIMDRQIYVQEDYSKVEPSPGKRLLLCDTSDASPITTKPEGGSRINIYHALCTIEIARQVLASLPRLERPIQLGEFRVGLITPYRKQAELLNHLIEDAHLENLVRAGTVHRFQGLEAEVIIFDTTESPPLSTQFTSGQRRSKAMRLVNVAVTRAKHKLIIVANSRYIQAKFYENDTLFLAVQEAQKAETINSRDVLDIKLPLSLNPSRSTLKGLEPQDLITKARLNDSDNISKYEPELLDDLSFYERFKQDMRSAKKQVVIFSPFLNPERTRQLIPIISERHKASVRITVITSTMKDSNPANSETGMLLKKAGVELRPAAGMHEKLVFIDDEIVYLGSLNVLSHIGTTELMVRVKSPKFVKKLRKFKNVDIVVESPTQWGTNIEVSFHELPNDTKCKSCGKALILRDGKFGAFYGCKGYPACNYAEDVGESHLDNVQRLTDIRCSGCGEQMKVKVNRKNAWLVCAGPTSCGYGQHITYSK